tara:strand:- start:2286 stop:2450 length:165 start_codon:yes stop_codon:yes gene_type:complete
MNINDFSRLVSEQEKGEKQVNIAQIKETLSVINKLLGEHYPKNFFYSLIKALRI